jgi:hypothetical protein
MIPKEEALFKRKSIPHALSSNGFSCAYGP